MEQKIRCAVHTIDDLLFMNPVIFASLQCCLDPVVLICRFPAFQQFSCFLLIQLQYSANDRSAFIINLFNVIPDLCIDDLQMQIFVFFNRKHFFFDAIVSVQACCFLQRIGFANGKIGKILLCAIRDECINDIAFFIHDFKSDARQRTAFIIDLLNRCLYILHGKMQILFARRKRNVICLCISCRGQIFMQNILFSFFQFDDGMGRAVTDPCINCFSCVFFNDAHMGIFDFLAAEIFLGDCHLCVFDRKPMTAWRTWLADIKFFQADIAFWCFQLIQDVGFLRIKTGDDKGIPA